MKTLMVLCALLTAGHIRAREIPYSAVVNYKKHMAKIYMRDIPVKIKLDGKKVAGIVNCTMESINFEGHAHLNMTITSDDFEDLLSFSVLVKAANPHTFNFYSNKWGSEGMDLLDVYSYNSERVGKKLETDQQELRVGMHGNMYFLISACLTKMESLLTSLSKTNMTLMLVLT